jgi:DNA-binding LacI/PurR family transcriptional regulator
MSRGALPPQYGDFVNRSRSGQARPTSDRQVTIEDVARAASVSRQTVSNVLNNSGRVGDAARSRVLDAVAALGYYPHQGARSLRSRRTRQIAFVMPRIALLPANYIMQQFLQAMAAACASRGYSMVIVVAGGNPPGDDPREEMRRLIASRSVDAFMLSELQEDDPRVALLAEAGFPFACFGRTAAGQPQQWVDIDNYEATALAVEHVVSLGFRRIAFAGYHTGNRWDNEREKGFRAGLERHGLPAGQARMLLVDDASARRAIRSLLASGRPGDRPEAIVSGSDRLAAIIYGVAAELRLRIGRDLAVTGFDGSAAADLLHPRLTSVAIPTVDIARRVVARALKQIDQGPDQLPGEVVPTRLRVGESTFRRDALVVSAGGSPAARNIPDVGTAWKPFQRGTGPRVTIADVAADARVGVGTVSRVLNGSDQVRESTARTVLDSIGRLGYRPSHTATALVRGTSRTVAILATYMTRPSTVVRIASALEVLDEQGYDTIVCNVESPAERDRHLEALLPPHRADGVLAICLPLSADQLGSFARAGVALASVDAVNPGVPQTIIDDAAGGRLAAEHLLSLGHRRIAFVGDTTFRKPPAGLGFLSSANRLRGFRQALADAGLEVAPGLIRRGEHDTAAAAELTAQLLKSADPPSAIFAASDTQAIGVLSAAERLGVPVPGQLSVVGFDDIESAAFLGLSTIGQPLRLSGAEGARRLCALLRGETVRPLRQELPIETIARGSSAQYRG